MSLLLSFLLSMSPAPAPAPLPVITAESPQAGEYGTILAIDEDRQMLRVELIGREVALVHYARFRWATRTGRLPVIRPGVEIHILGDTITLLQ